MKCKICGSEKVRTWEIDGEIYMECKECLSKSKFPKEESK